MERPTTPTCSEGGGDRRLTGVGPGICGYGGQDRTAQLREAVLGPDSILRWVRDRRGPGDKSEAFIGLDSKDGQVTLYL